MTTKIEIVDETGHQELEVQTGQEGLDVLKPYQASKDYWIYTDGKLVNNDRLTADDIESAQSVQVGLSQQGGC